MDWNFHSGIPAERRGRLGLISQEEVPANRCGRVQKLSRRGRWTIIGMIPLAFFVLWGSMAFVQPPLDPVRDFLPPVSAPPPMRQVPESILSSVPVGSDEVDRLLQQSPGSYLQRTWTETDTDSGEKFQVEYTMHPELEKQVLQVLRAAKERWSHVIVADPATGRILAFASTDPKRFPSDRTYPAASLVKIVTAAAAMQKSPKILERDCWYSGNPYRLTSRHLEISGRGKSSSFERALATSNNQCFARIAVHDLGAHSMVRALSAFGILQSPGPGYPAGKINVGTTDLDLGQLGSGLAGTEITPLHAIQLAMTLADGKLRKPRWIHRVTNEKQEELPLDFSQSPEEVMSQEEANRIRELLVATTKEGTAKKAFRRRNGKMLLDPIRISGKTGSLTGENPPGRYEWFVGVAPAEKPSIAIVVVTVHQDLWYQSSSQIAAEVLKKVFCPDGVCRAEAAARWTNPSPPSEISLYSVDLE